jgi:hypothetical protein
VGLKSSGAVVIGLVLVLAAWALMLLYAPVAAPTGYHFPHHAIFGGMDALYEGVLVDVDGCVMTEGGDTVVWPPGYGLEMRDGRLVVVGGGRVVGMSEAVAMGGGFLSRDVIAGFSLAVGSADVPCGDNFFVMNGWAD